MTGFVYILRSQSSGRYYIGSSIDPQRRLIEHNNGETKSIRNKGPWKIVLQQDYPDIVTAKRVELKLKSLKRRDYLDKIIESKKITISLED
jgi:putative endonuclease